MSAPCLVVGEGLALSLLASERSLVASGTILATRKSTFAFCKRDLYCKVCGAVRVTFALLGPVCFQMDDPYYNFCVFAVSTLYHSAWPS
jgi:hypothetical protein